MKTSQNEKSTGLRFHNPPTRLGMSEVSRTYSSVTIAVPAKCQAELAVEKTKSKDGLNNKRFQGDIFERNSLDTVNEANVLAFRKIERHRRQSNIEDWKRFQKR